MLVKLQIEKLKVPALNCVDMVFEELWMVAKQCGTGDLARFGTLQDRIGAVVKEMLDDLLGPCKELVEQLVCLETSYINTNHPDFISASKAVSATMFDKDKSRARNSDSQGTARQSAPRVPKKPQPVVAKRNPVPDPVQQPSSSGFLGGLFGGGNASVPVSPARPKMKVERKEDDSLYDNSNNRDSGRESRSLPHSLHVREPSDREQVETRIIKMLIESYYNIVRKNIQDAIPKAIMYLLVNKSKDLIQNNLVTSLYKDSQYAELLKEDEVIASKRAAAKTLLQRLQAASEIISEIRNMPVEKEFHRG